jgi:hypothetical protein
VVRRLLLVLLALSGVGFFTVNAASFATNAEDVATFTTDTTLTEPSVPCPEQAVPLPIVVRSVDGARLLDPPPADPAVTDPHLWSAGIGVTGRGIRDQDNNEFLLWRWAPPQGCPFRLQGDLTLHIGASFGGGVIISRREILPYVKAQLFVCPVNAPDKSLIPACTPLGPSEGAAQLDGLGQNPLTIGLGTVDGLVPPGSELRLKVVANPAPSITLFGSVNLFWQYYSDTDASLNSRIDVS